MARGAIAYKGQLYLGGSKVEANPTGSAEGGNLSKLGVDDTIYAIPQVNNGTLTIQKNGTNVATFSANQSENVTANIDVSEDIAGTQTVSGNPITLTDCAPINAESLVVELEPKQDLHGHDFPWVGGAGLNKVDINPVTMSSDGYYLVDYVIPNTLPVGTYTLSIKTSSNAAWSFWVHDANGNEVGVANSASSSAGVQSVTFTTSGIGVVAGGYVNAATTLSDFMLESGSVAHDYQPYSNICPITGYTECEVDDVGVNQWDEEWELGQISVSDGSKVSSNTNIRSKNYIPVIGGETYYFTNYQLRMPACYDENKTFISAADATAVGLSGWLLTMPENAKYMLFDMSNDYGTTYLNNLSLNNPNTDHDYHAYQSSNATIQFGQTVYSGTLDVTNGVLTVDMATQTITSVSDRVGAYQFYSSALQGAKSTSYTVEDAISNEIPYNKSSYGSNVFGFATNNGSLYIRLPFLASDTKEAANTFLTANPLQVCYPLAEPFTIQLTPAELKLLLKYNNITTNGTTINLDYIPNNSIGDAVKASEEYTDRRMDALGDLAYINEDGDNSTKFLRGDGTWQNTPAGVTTLAALTDTTISSPSNGQVLKYDGSKWVNSADYSLPTASASKLGGVKVGANLSIDADGVLSATGGGGANALNDLTDVSAASPQNKQVLAYDSSQSKWVAVDADVVAIPRSYWSSTTRELDFMITVPAYNTQRILKFSLMHAVGLAASEYMFALDRGDVYSSKMAGDTCGISSSYTSSTNTYTITITMPSVSGSPNFIFAMTMYNGSDKTW